MIKNLKKAFTIIELVIVIAVIAILAAVLIPTYSSLVEKANQSADIQAVKQMNTILALDEVDSNKTIADVHLALSAEGLNSKNFTPLVSDTYFYWIEEENRIVYVDNEKNIIYPEDLKDKIDLKAAEGNEKNRYYCSLNGVIEESSSGVMSDDGTTATVTTAEQLYYLSNHLDTHLTRLSKIIFSTPVIDAHGASISFNFDNSSSLKNITIEGDSNGTIIKNAVSLKKQQDIYNNETNDTLPYGSGFVGYVGKNVNLTISNVTIDGGVFGDLEVGGVGALIGRIQDGSQEVDSNGDYTSVKIDNCHVKNAIINGKNKVGALVGSIGGNKKTVKVSECTVSDCIVNCSEGESGKAIGCLYGVAKMTIDKKFSEWVNNTILNLITTDKRDIVDGSSLEIKCESDGILFTDSKCEYIVQKYDYEKDKTYNTYRMFNSQAYMTAQFYDQDDNMIDITIANNNDKSVKKQLTTNYSNLSIAVLKFY